MVFCKCFYLLTYLYMQPTTKEMWMADDTELSTCSGKIGLKLMYADAHFILHRLVLARHV